MLDTLTFNEWLDLRVKRAQYETFRSFYPDAVGVHRPAGMTRNRDPGPAWHNNAIEYGYYLVFDGRHTDGIVYWSYRA